MVAFGLQTAGDAVGKPLHEWGANDNVSEAAAPVIGTGAFPDALTSQVTLQSSGILIEPTRGT